MKFPKAATWPSVVLIILLLVWMWWGLARLLSGGWIDQKIAELRYGGRQLHHAPLPPIKDWNSLRIMLARECEQAPCQGDYSVQVVGEHRVEFTSSGAVATPGNHVASIDPSTVHALYDQFRQADFSSLRPSYRGPAFTGAGARQPPRWRLLVSYDGLPAREVTDFRGEAIGMPQEVGDLEQAVYSRTGAARWVEGNDQTIPSLVAEGWDLTADSPQNGALLIGAAQARNAALVRALLAAGAPAKGVYGCRALTVSAFGRQYKPVFEMLRAAGAPIQSGDCTVPDKWPRLGSD